MYWLYICRKGGGGNLERLKLKVYIIILFVYFSQALKGPVDESKKEK